MSRSGSSARTRAWPRTLAVLYDVKKKDNAGTKWVKDLRTWWRKAGRDVELPMDGVSGATRTAGVQTLSFAGRPAGLDKLPAGDYKLVIEAAREAGGRELVRVPFTWPSQGQAGRRVRGQGRAGRGVDHGPIRRPACRSSKSSSPSPSPWPASPAPPRPTALDAPEHDLIEPTAAKPGSRSTAPSRKACSTRPHAAETGRPDGHRPGRRTAPAPAATLGKFRSSVDIKLPKDGTYRITLAAVNVMGSYKLNGEMKRFRATEQTARDEVPAGATEVRSTTMVQRQDTFVTLNKPTTGALKPTGSGLELVPVTNPNELRAGEKATFRFQLDGKPLANFPFSLIPGGVKYRGTLNEVRLTTDANGDASFTLPAPNMYWLSAGYPANAPRGMEGSRRSATATRPRSRSCRSNR
jgi:hypothetical protein